MAVYDKYPIEYQASQFYIKDSYVNTYYYTYKFLEGWLAETIFRNDKSRVFLASDQYAFRRRFELTDTSKNFEDLEFSSLRLPFANYFPHNNGWVADDRIAGKSAVLSYSGMYVGDTKIKAASSSLEIPTTFYFDREDDARMAYEILYFKSFNEHYYSIKVPYGTTMIDDNGTTNEVLALPMNVTVTALQFNPSSTEKDWLNKQRIFVVRATFKIRSFVVVPPNQPDYKLTLNANGTLSDGTKYTDGINFYSIVDHVILNFSNDKTTMVTYDAGYDEIEKTYKGTNRFPAKGEVGVIYVDSYQEESYEHKEGSHPIYVWDSINSKYVSPDKNFEANSMSISGYVDSDSVEIDKFDYVTNITKYSNKIEWDFGPNTLDKTTYNELLKTTENYSKDSSYKKDDYCVYDNDLYTCKSDSISNEKWNPKNWIKVDHIITDIELHMSNLEDFVNIDITSKSYLLTDLKKSTTYLGYMIFYTEEGISKKMMIDFDTNDRDSSSKKTADPSSIIGISF